MYQKRLSSDSQKSLRDISELNLQFSSNPPLEDFTLLTPTTLAFFESMNEGNNEDNNFNPQDDNISGEFSGNLNQDNTQTSFASEDDSDAESSDGGFDSRVVPVSVSSDQYGAGANQSQPSQKMKSLKRKLPGPRPAYSDDELTVEEMQRRTRRRERNKMAAARCRQRRVDQTNELLNETKNLELEASRLEKEIENLEKLKQKLEIVLQSHMPLCTANVQHSEISTTASVTNVTNIKQQIPAPGTSLYLTSAQPNSTSLCIVNPQQQEQQSQQQQQQHLFQHPQQIKQQPKVIVITTSNNNNNNNIVGLTTRPHTLPVISSLSTSLPTNLTVINTQQLQQFQQPQQQMQQSQQPQQQQQQLQQQSNNNNIFNFDTTLRTPVTSASEFLTTPDTNFSAFDYLTPTTAEQQILSPSILLSQP